MRNFPRDKEGEITVDNNKASQLKYSNTYLVAAILMMVGSSVVLHLFKVPTIMGDIAKDTGIANPAILMSVFTFVGIIFAVPAGILANKFGSKTLCIVACLLVGLGSIIGGMTHSGDVLLVSRAIEGIGYIFISVAAPITVASYVNPKDIGVAMGVWAIWMSVGQIISFNLTRALFGVMSWNNIWFIYAIITIALSVILGLYVKKPTLATPLGLTDAPKPEDLVETGQWGKLLHNRDFMCLVLAFLIFNYLIIQTVTFIPQFAVSTGLMGNMEAAFAGTILMIGSIVGSPIIGKLGDMLGRKRFLILAFLACGLGMAIIYSGTRSGLYIGSAIFGVIGATAPGIILAAIPGIVGHKLMGLATGITFIGVNTGQFLATLLFVPILAKFGGAYGPAVWATAVPLAVVAMILSAIPKYE